MSSTLASSDEQQAFQGLLDRKIFAKASQTVDIRMQIREKMSEAMAHILKQDVAIETNKPYLELVASMIGLPF